MTDSSNSAAWGKAWLDAQKSYWEAWQEMAGQAPGPAGATAANPWPQGLDFWAGLLGSSLPEESREIAQRLFELNKGYLKLGEGLWKLTQQAGEGAQTAENWWQSLTQGMQQYQQDLTKQMGTGDDPWAGFATFWGMPLDTWRRVTSACSVMPGDMEKALRGSGPPHPNEALQGLLSTPALGYTREWQEQVQRWGLLWLEHSQALQEYARVLSGVTNRAGDLLGKKLQASAAGEAPVESLRALYDLWIDCAEEAYSEVSVSDDFTRIQGQLTNTLMAVKRHEQEMMDELLSGLNMPTRRELDTSHRRTHELERRIWRLREQLEDSGIEALRDEVAALRNQLQASQSRPTASPQRSKKKTATKKAAAKKAAPASRSREV